MGTLQNDHSKNDAKFKWHSRLLDAAPADGLKKVEAPRRGGAARQLGKGDKNKVRGIHNRAAYSRERVRLTQHWADRLDSLA